MRRIFSVLLVVGMVSFSYGLYRLKYEVRELDQRSASLRQELEQSRAAVDVLLTEWAYLSRPERLEDLNRQFLGLAPMQRHQVVTLGDLPMRSSVPPAGAVNDHFATVAARFRPPRPGDVVGGQ